MRSAAPGMAMTSRVSIAIACMLLAGAMPAPAQVRNLAGAVVDPLRAAPPVKAVVLIFVSIECPISNRYAPEIQRVAGSFAASDVRLYLVYPSPSESPKAIRQHLKDYGYPDLALRDPGHELVKLARSSVTPEAAVFNSRGALVYHGRIDDRYAELGRERPAPTKHDLQDAIAATLAGKPVVPSTTQAFGCFLADLR